jgi:hypothetical protein
MAWQVVSKLMLYGFIVAEELFLTVIFFRLWRSSHEKLFAFFAAGFAVMGIHRIGLGVALANGVALERQTLFFLVRLLSYVLIFAGVVVKNMDRRTQGRGARVMH